MVKNETGNRFALTHSFLSIDRRENADIDPFEGNSADQSSVLALFID